MKTIKLMCVLALVSFGSVACGDDSSDSNNKNTGGGAVTAADVADCKAVCDKQNTGGCLDGTLDECKSDCDAGAAATGDCATKSNALTACGKAAVDICVEDACVAEALAALAACMAAQS